MRYVLPALPVSGPRGNRARRREAARLAQRQGAARRSGKTRPAVAPPRLLQKLFALRVIVTLWKALCSLNNKLQNYNKSSALITILRSNKTTRLQDCRLRLQAYRLRLQAHRLRLQAPKLRLQQSYKNDRLYESYAHCQRTDFKTTPAGITREIDLQCFHTAKEEPMKGVHPGRCPS